jgi:hypothetical protein
MRKRVIAVTGPLASGKSPAIAGLQARGALVISLSDFARALRGLGDDETTRTEMQDFSNELAGQFGDDYLARLAAAVIDGNEAPLFVVDGVRRPGEFALLSRAYGAERVAIVIATADQHANVARRDRPSDTRDPRGVPALAARDRGAGEPPEGQRVDDCIALVPPAQRIHNPGEARQFAHNLVAGLNPVLERLGIAEIDEATLARGLREDEG